MKFKYLKLTLLMAALFMVPFAAQAETKVDRVVKDLVEYLNPDGPKRTAQETIDKFDEVMVVLAEYPEYKDLSQAVGETKELFVRASIAQAKGVFERVSGQLETLHNSLAPETKGLVDGWLNKIKNLSYLKKGMFLEKMGIRLFGKK